MYADLRGKVAVVTGASKGLGTAIARRLADEGVHLVIDYHEDRTGAEEVTNHVDSLGGKAFAVQADVREEREIENLRETALREMGRLDIWVNNAGKETQSSTHEMSLSDWQDVLDVNLTGVFLGTRCALRHFIENSVRGNIINISSVHEIIPWPTFAHYAASKGAVGMFTKSVAMEYAPLGIRINAIGPGAMNTPINAEKFSDQAQLETTIGMIPIQKIGDPEDVGAAAAWLASDQAKYVTGVTLYVDGGMTLYPSFQGGNG